MLEMNIVRNNPDAVRESEKKRFHDPAIVDEVLRVDQEWRKTKDATEKMLSERNSITKQISELAKKKQDIKPLKQKVTEINTQIPEMEKHTAELAEQREQLLKKIGNILHPDVPVAQTEEGSVERRKWGTIPQFSFTPKGHADIVVDMGLVDLDTAAKVAGARFYFLKDDLVLMNYALIQFGLNHLKKHGYTILQPPFMLNYAAISGAAELSDFADQLYKIEGEDLYLIATSEQALANLHADQILRPDVLPLRYGGISSCFRKEAGTAGKDMKGIFRVHQFEKVEQYVYCKPEDSWSEHERIIQLTEEFFQQLGIPYHVIDIASGDLNNAAARKYDLEGWFPAQNRYRELVSCSNVTSYQANPLHIRVGYHGSDKVLAHTLNSTVVATERTLCCILENYQQTDGTVSVPTVLRPYMGGQEVIHPKKTQ